MSLYKRRRSKERPVSVYTGRSSPVLVSYKNQYSTSQPTSPFSDESLSMLLTNAYSMADNTCISEESGCALDTTLTSSCNTQSENLDVEVSHWVLILQHTARLDVAKILSAHHHVSTTHGCAPQLVLVYVP